MKRAVLILVLAMLLAGSGQPALATLYDDIGYTQLVNELGADVPTGAGVEVTQVEAYSGSSYLPGADPQFTGKTFNPPLPSTNTSAHATTAGRYFYGNISSLAPGITNISCYEASDWLGSGFLGNLNSAPLISSSRVANHSYVGSMGTSGSIYALARMDWVVSRDEYIQVVASSGTGYPLLGSSFNAIAVGLSNGSFPYGSYPLPTTITTPYATAGRTRPDLVVPLTATSYATPVVSGAAALLVGVGHDNPGLSRDPLVNSTTNRAGDTIYNAERSEVVKAALMAGADRLSPNLTNTKTPNGYTVNTANGLSNIYGAGQLNIDNSYHIIAAGEQNSREDYPAGKGEITAAGFDYDPYFGGLNGSNKTGSYVFRALSTGTLSASLVWNLAVTGDTANGFDTTATLYNLGLYLYDMTDSTEVAYAASLVDNTENIWYTSLIAGDSYLLQVASLESTDFLWDYGLAWDITADTTHAPLPPTLYLLGSGIVALVLLRRKGRVISKKSISATPPGARLG
jgi:hypothetical protein